MLGVTDRRVLLWGVSRWVARPTGPARSIGLADVAGVTMARRFGASRLRVVLATGPQVLLEPLWGGSLATLAAAYSAVAGPV